METLSRPRLKWTTADFPSSSSYSDVFFSSLGAAEEYRHVFLKGNDLPGRWANPADSTFGFRIGELGFGTGLGFLCTWSEWLRTSTAGAELRFLSFEKHPWAPEDLRRAWKPYPELARLGEELLRSYPAPVEGIRTVRLRRCTLTLVLGDALTWAPKITAPVGAPPIDAWFLHGFAPAKNPDLWSVEIFRQLARLSGPRTTLSTFSVAAEVRRNLAAAGFACEKAPGIGDKQEILRARFDFASATLPTPASPIAPGFRSRWNPAPRSPRAIVIGGGLAGCAAASRMAERGCAVTLLEGGAELAGGASGNPAGLLMPFLASEPDTKCRIALSAFLTAIGILKPIGFPQRGVLQVARSARENERWLNSRTAMGLPPEIARAIDSSESEQISGWGTRLRTPYGAMLLGQGGSIAPRALCRKILDSPGPSQIEVRLGYEVADLRRSEGGSWCAYSPRGELLAEADWVVIASALQARRLPVSDFLPLQPVRGQLGWAPVDFGDFSGLDALGSALPLVCGQYLVPSESGRWVFGASYARRDEDSRIRPEENLRMWQELRKNLPDLPELGASAQEGRVSFRAYTPDAICVAGPLPDREAFRERFQDLRKGYPQDHYPDSADLSGIAVSVGHGSRGIASAFLAAEVLSAQFFGDFHPVEPDLLEALHPARFLIREINRSGMSNSTSS